MPTIRNVNPIGDVEVPLLRRIVARGADVDVTPDQAARLLPQADNWQPVDKAAKAIHAELNKPADEPAEITGEGEPA